MCDLVVAIGVGVHEADERDAPSGRATTSCSAARLSRTKLGSQQQVLGRVAGDGELGERQQVAALVLGISHDRQDPLHVAGEIADHGVDLGETDADRAMAAI